MKFRKKSGEVEAVQWLGNEDEIKEFVGKDCSIIGAVLHIDLPGGYMIVSPGDYVVKDDGEYYSCEPSIFEKKYEVIDEDAKIMPELPYLNVQN